MDVTHRLAEKKFLRLEEALLHLYLELVRLIIAKEQKFEVLDQDWLHLEHGLDDLLEN